MAQVCHFIDWNIWKTIWESRCRRPRNRNRGGVAELIKPTRDELIRQAEQGEVLHNDDTGIQA
jgi:hypothetical protein